MKCNIVPAWLTPSFYTPTGNLFITPVSSGSVRVRAIPLHREDNATDAIVRDAELVEVVNANVALIGGASPLLAGEPDHRVGAHIQDNMIPDDSILYCQYDGHTRRHSRGK